MPFQVPSHSETKKSLSPVTRWMCEKEPKILMGSKICDSCRKKLKDLPDFQGEPSDSDHEAEADEDYVGEPLLAINHCLNEIGETPIMKKKKSSTIQNTRSRRLRKLLLQLRRL